MAIDYKKTTASVTTITRDVDEMIVNDNIYQTVIVVAKRANQISLELKDELSRKLEEFATYADNLEEIHENHEQIEISRYYERLPKPTAVALQEYLEGKIYYRQPETTENQNA